VASELQNQPRVSETSTSMQLDLEYLVRRCSVEIPQGVVPAWAAVVFCAVDVGVHRLHWETSAFSHDGATSVLVDEGIQETGINEGGRWQLTEAPGARRLLAADGIRAALDKLRERFADGWPAATGGRMMPSLVGVDCGGAVDGWAWYDVIIRYCQLAGPRWHPLKGEAWSDSIADRAHGRHWIREERGNPGCRIDCDVNVYKKRVAEGFERPSFDQERHPVRVPGCCITTRRRNICATRQPRSILRNSFRERPQQIAADRLDPGDPGGRIIGSIRPGCVTH